MKRKQLITIVASLVVAIASAPPLSSQGPATGYCDPARVCNASCDPADVAAICKEYQDIGCIWLGAECWDDGSQVGCNSAGYSAVICYYSI